MSDEAVILFDGHCNVCSASVRFIIPRDRSGRLMFASLQSEPGQKLLVRHRLNGQAIKSVVVIAGGHAYTRSRAALEIARHLRLPWRLAMWLVVIPAPVRDWLYDQFAEHRYRFFGRSESCLMPTPELRRRFLAG